ncbi:transglutaminase domain-containing protein [Eubacterium sp.]|uniref:transglutaminase domain-containing protein n=1 Tax=Eubacterium sp. TaxID=142586 RepID=UPI0026E0CD96|nr:transglutaminase domain-containing protein [Eubacterium sp.]MDO5434644.1 transglutaminase domain-containing protein [Eubacterium sp.]
MIKKKIWIIAVVMLLLFIFPASVSAKEDNTSMEMTVQSDSPLFVDYPNSYEAVQCDSPIGSKYSQSAEKQLSSIAQLFYEKMINQDTTPLDITEYQLTWEQVQAYVNEASLYDPLAYIAMKSFGYRYSSREIETGGHITYSVMVEFNFTLTKEEYDQRYEKLRRSVDVALQSVDNSMTNAEKILALHDYLAQSITYEKSTDDAHSAYGALVDQQCVCEGYSKALNLLLSQINIPSFMVTSDAMNHAWNMVQLEGNWYHVDVTFDDPIREYDPEPSDYVRYTNFLLTDDQMKNETEHYGWNSEVTATDDTYVDLPRVRGRDGGVAQQTYGGGCWYYTEPNQYGYASVISRSDFYGKRTVDFLTGQKLCGVLYKNGMLYYSEGQSVYRNDLSTNQKEWLYTLSDEEKGYDNPAFTQIYSLFNRRDGGVNYHYFGFDSSLTNYFKAGVLKVETPFIKGDLDGNGKVDIMDARKAKRAAMKDVVLKPDELKAADLNGDGKVDIMEARKIKRAAMKEIVLE